ncbi:MAG TPA: hypothetical protein VMX56_05055 [Anaerolineales bacterium]|nr:hypothetical protein [Anaerolineales bacterium]
MAKDRWGIVIGGILLIVMLMLGSFSIGVYLGRLGTKQEAPGNDAAAPPSIPPQNSLQEKVGDDIQIHNPDLVGRLKFVGKDGIQLTTDEGNKFVTVDEDTRLWNWSGETLQLRDLGRYDILAVYGDFIDDGRQLHAELIVRLPPRNPGNP